MTQVGDRVERAIEEHADAEQEIERGEAAAPPRRRIVRTVSWLALTGVSLYLVAPSLVEVLGSWEDLDQLSPAWLGPDARAPGRRDDLRMGAPVPRHAGADVSPAIARAPDSPACTSIRYCSAAPSAPPPGAT